MWAKVNHYFCISILFVVLLDALLLLYLFFVMVHLNTYFPFGSRGHNSMTLVSPSPLKAKLQQSKLNITKDI